MPRLFAPTARQLNVIIVLAMSALGYALYLRYFAVEFSSVGLACQAGLKTWLCWTRSTVIAIFQHWGFGISSLLLAILHVLRPSLVLFSASLIAACFGIVLYNLGLASLAIGLLIVSFARRVSDTV